MPVLAKKEYCTGCGACASICPNGCIVMEPDGNGFLFPSVQSESCTDCSLCQRCCPIIHPRKPDETAMPEAYAAYSRDTAMRLESSSGGIFSELAKAVLKQNGAVFGAAYNNCFEVCHICAETEEDLAQLRGAKYAQSNLGDTFSAVKSRLELGQPVIFSGTPCQVGGLKAFLRKDYRNLITVDFVCHSVPSPMAWQAYVKYRADQDNRGEYPLSINLRHKETGWSKYQYANVFRYANAPSHAAKSGDSLYMRLFVGGYISRESCEHCHFKGYQRISDLTIGDFWGIWDIAPEMDDNRGTSLVLVHSEQGRALLDRITDRLILKSVTPEEASRQNGAMLQSARPNARRPEAFALIRTGNIGQCEAWFAPAPPSLWRRIGRKIRAMLRSHP